MRTNTIDELMQTDLFEHEGRRRMRLIDTISTEIEVGRARTLCRQGELGMEFFVLLHGEVAVRHDDAIVNRLGAHDYFGEVALMSPDGRRIASIETATPARLLVFNRREFRALMDAYPQARRRCFASAVDRHLACLADVRPPLLTLDA
jgi:CRP-like cAMP-binding protein